MSFINFMLRVSCGAICCYVAKYYCINISAYWYITKNYFFCVKTIFSKKIKGVRCIYVVATDPDGLAAVAVRPDEFSRLGRLGPGDAVAVAGPNADVVVDGYGFVARGGDDLLDRCLLTPRLLVWVEDDVVHLKEEAVRFFLGPI